MNVDFQEQDIIITFTPEGQDGQSVRPIGAWSADETYRILDLVSYQGDSYIAVKNVPVGTLPTNTTYWMINASNATPYWGRIEGTLADQTDLKDALDAKADADDVYTKTQTDDLLSAKADASAVYTTTEVDNLLSAKADADNVYTKTEADSLLFGKADKSTTYTKTQVDDALDLKADKADTYTKTELDGIFDGIDNALDTKADKTDVYTKTQTDNLLSAKANTADLSALAEKDTVDYQTEVTNKPTLGDLAGMDSIDYTSNYLTNKPTLGSLADQDTVDYETEVTNKPTLGTMSAENATDYYTKSATDALLQDKADIILSSASGSIASFSDGGAYPVTALTVGIEPVQDLHGYDNPWPAGGGKNLHKPYSYSIHIENVDVTYSTDGSVTLNGGVVSVTSGTPSVSTAVQNGYTYTLPAGTYIASMSGSTSNVGLDVYNTSTVTRLAGANEAFTLSASTTILVRISILSGKSYSNQKLYLQLESGSTATSYAPYSNVCPISGHTEANIYHEAEYDADADPTLTIDLDGTRYGGSINVLTGEMTVTHGIADLGALSWNSTPAGAYTRMYSTDLVGSIKPQTNTAVAGDIICSNYKTAAFQTLIDGNAPYAVAVSHTGSIGVVDPNHSNPATFKTAMSGVKLVYKLATPLTVQLTPAQLISTLLGENNIWSDTGDVAVEYRADSKMYIDQQIAESQRATRSLIAGIETEMVASKNYTVGDLLIVGDSLYTVTANIGSGSAITVGTNVAVTTVAEQLIALANA